VGFISNPHHGGMTSPHLVTKVQLVAQPQALSARPPEPAIRRFRLALRHLQPARPQARQARNIQRASR
jgi:hypothetical protein